MFNDIFLVSDQAVSPFSINMLCGWRGARWIAFPKFSNNLVLMTIIAKADNHLLEPVFPVGLMKSGNRPIIRSYEPHGVNAPVSK
jgi:hypothetical protein